MTKKVMKLICDRTGEMQCKVCGASHYSNVKEVKYGKTIYHRGSWQCQNGCKIEDNNIHKFQEGCTAR